MRGVRLRVLSGRSERGELHSVRGLVRHGWVDSMDGFSMVFRTRSTNVMLSLATTILAILIEYQKSLTGECRSVTE